MARPASRSRSPARRSGGGSCSGCSASAWPVWSAARRSRAGSRSGWPRSSCATRPGCSSTLPLGPVFRFYSVTGGVEPRDAKTYRLRSAGWSPSPSTYRLDDLRALPQTSFTSDFHCVTGWVVPGVAVGRRPALRAARPGPAAAVGEGRAVPLVRRRLHREPDPGRRPGVRTWSWRCEMLGGPVSHDHGGPVRMYVDGQYGYKSTKWLSGIELTEDEVPGLLGAPRLRRRRDDP